MRKSSSCTKVIQDVVKWNWKIFPSLICKRMPQIQLKTWFVLDSNRLTCLTFNHEKYHFLLELLSCVIAWSLERRENTGICLQCVWQRANIMFKQLNQTRLNSAVSLTHHNSVSKTCVIFMIGRTTLCNFVIWPHNFRGSDLSNGEQCISACVYILPLCSSVAKVIFRHCFCHFFH